MNEEIPLNNIPCRNCDTEDFDCTQLLYTTGVVCCNECNHNAVLPL